MRRTDPVDGTPAGTGSAGKSDGRDRGPGSRAALTAAAVVAVALALGGVGAAVALHRATADAGSAPAASAAGPPTPLGPGRGPCANRQDPALRALVDQALPAAVGARTAATTDICRPGDQRWVSVELDGDVLTVADLPAGTPAAAEPGTVRARTASGGTVVVSDRYPQLLPYLAPRL